MEDSNRKSIRRLLKTFGIRADEALVAYLARHPEVESMKVRITLENVTSAHNGGPTEALHLVVEDIVDRV
jgi:hypothetical protein